MKKIIIYTFCVLTVISMIIPSWAFAQTTRERDERPDRGITSPQETEPAPDPEPEDSDTSTSNGGSTVTVQNSIIITTSSGDNSNEDGEDGITTGDENADVFVETIVNGEVVQTIQEDGEDVAGDDDRRNRRRTFEDRGRGISVETTVDIEEEGGSSDTGNQNADGADGENGADGEDGADGTPTDNSGEESNDEEPTGSSEEDDDRGRDRADRPSRGGLALNNFLSSVTNFFTNVLSFFFV